MSTVRYSERPKTKICSVEDCDKDSHAKTLCFKHYYRMKRHGTLEIDNPRQSKPIRYCEVIGCENKSKTKGYCGMHYERIRRNGEPGPPERLRSKMGYGENLDGYRRIVIDRERVLEHRAVMENILGRKLNKNENVHHKNGDRADNRPENLELWSSSQPPGQRVQDKVEWAIEILKLYDPEVLR